MVTTQINLGRGGGGGGDAKGVRSSEGSGVFKGGRGSGGHLGVVAGAVGCCREGGGSRRSRSLWHDVLALLLTTVAK